MKKFNSVEEYKSSIPKVVNSINKLMSEIKMNRNRSLEELDEASNGNMGAMPGKTYSEQPVNKAIAKINAIVRK